MPNQAVTLSSVGTSGAVHINWRGGKPITAQLTMATTTMTADYTLQYTMQDTMLSTTSLWFGLSSNVGSSATHYTAANGDNAVLVTLPSPVAGLRISSTAISSSSLTLRVIQGEGW